MVYSATMKTPKLQLTDEQKEITKQLGRLGGLARAKSLTAKKRRAIATKASKAAAAARKKKKAKEKKKEQ
jgi:hypothetical protein